MHPAPCMLHDIHCVLKGTMEVASNCLHCWNLPWKKKKKVPHLFHWKSAAIKMKWEAAPLCKFSTESRWYMSPQLSVSLFANTYTFSAPRVRIRAVSWRRAETSKDKQTISLGALPRCHTLPALPEQTRLLKAPGFIFPAELLWPHRAASCQA